MTDAPRADDSADKQSQQEAVPSSEQKTPEPQKVAEVADQSEGAKQPQEEGTEGLPKDAKERTKEQFDKLTTQNRELKERLKEPILGNYGTQTQPTQPGKEGESKWTDQYTDPNTGELSLNALNELASEQGRLKEELSKQRTANQRTSDESQEREALEAYPQLDKDLDFRRKTRGIFIDAQLNPKDYGGKQLSLKQAAELVGAPKKEIKDAEKAGATKALEGLSAKEAASVEAPGRSDRRQSTQSLQDLQQATRKGNLQATIERMKSLPKA